MGIELRITVRPDGQVEVNGPIKDPGLCMKLIAKALEAIADFNKEAAPMIQPARLVPVPRNGQ